MSMGETLHDKRWLYFLMVASGVLLSTMDSSMVNVALPEIMRYFAVGLIEVKLVVLVYLMVITCSLVFWGRISDQLGKGRMYMTGMVIFVGGAVACAISTSFHLLVVSRSVQAIGASMMMSTGPAILKLTTPPEHLGRTLGLVGIATSCGLMSGPLVSGIVLSLYSWREVFLVSVPLATLVVVLGTRYLVRDLSKVEKRRRMTFDWRGGGIWVGVVATYVLLVNGSFVAWPVHVVLLAAFLGLLLVFFRVERNVDTPIMPLLLVRERYYWTSVAASAISFAALFIVLILMPFYLDYILGYPASSIGFAMTALPVSLVIMSPLSGWLYDRLGSARLISTAGLLLCSIAVISLMCLDPASSFISVFWRLTLLGAGQSIFLSPNSASVLTRVQEAYAGITSGILATARNFGMLSGTALAGVGFALPFSRFTGGLTLQDFQPAHVESFLRAQQFSLSLALLLLLTGCCISWLRG